MLIYTSRLPNKLICQIGTIKEVCFILWQHLASHLTSPLLFTELSPQLTESTNFPIISDLTKNDQLLTKIVSSLYLSDNKDKWVQ